MTEPDYNICPVNANGKHGPLRAGIDMEINNTHVSIECRACGISTGYPIPDVDELEWN